MRVGTTSPWFRDSLYREIPPETVRAMEPRTATLTGIADKRGIFKTARVTQGGTTYEGTARTSGEALRLALGKLHAAERVEVVSMLSGPAA